MGYDAGKKVKGRKLHALVDVSGLPLRVIVHSAGIQDRDGAALVLDKIRQRFPWLELVWADGGYNAHQVKDAVAKSPGLRVEIVKRTDDIKLIFNSCGDRVGRKLLISLNPTGCDRENVVPRFRRVLY